MTPGFYMVSATHTQIAPLSITPSIGKTIVAHLHVHDTSGGVYVRSSSGPWTTVTHSCPVQLAVFPGDTLDLATSGVRYHALSTLTAAPAQEQPYRVEVSVVGVG